jgi:hypothetical protein
MDDEPADESGGLTPADEIYMRFAAMSPEQQRRTLALIERIEAAGQN